MTTRTFSSIAVFSSNELFRQIGLTVSTQLTDVGLVKTTDTGQIDWSTVNMPGGSNTYVGYEIRKFSDTHQLTSPVFIRFDYGATGSSTTFGIRITVGSETDGAGSIVGVAKTSTILCSLGNNPPSAGVSYPCYMSLSDGFFGMYLFASTTSGGATDSMVLVSRTVDNNGNPTSRGLVVYAGANTSSVGSSAPINWQCLRFTGVATAYSLRTTVGAASFTCIPGSVTNTSDDDSNKTVFMHMMISPNPVPINQVATVVAAELGVGTQFTTAIVGASTRTYIGLGVYAGRAEASGSANYALAMLWE